MYDCIIVGSGLGGLSAGLRLAKENKKVLILEKNSLPGGLVRTIKRGRFEFDLALTDFYGINSVKELFRSYGIEIDSEKQLFNTKIRVLDNDKEFVFRGETKDIFEKLEKSRPDSLELLNHFLDVIKEVNEAFNKLVCGEEKIDEYPNFLKYINFSALEAMRDLKIPESIIHVLSFNYLYLGTTLDKLNFIDYAIFMGRFLLESQGVLTVSNSEFVLNLVKRFQELNGKIFYRSKVTEISDEGLYKVVKTSDNKSYKAKDVICNLAKRYVYSNLIPNISKEENRLENARTIAPNGVTVYLGLNKSHEELGIKYYHYYQFEHLKGELNIKNMGMLKHHTWESTVPNVINDSISPKNTSILILKTIYFGDAWKNINLADYKVKEDIALALITEFEIATGIDIKEYIEEIEIVTPYDLEMLTNTPNGSMMGYMQKGYDNMIHRVISFDDEQYPNLYFVGASSVFAGGACNAILSGDYVANKILKKGRSQDE